MRTVPLHPLNDVDRIVADVRAGAVGAATGAVSSERLDALRALVDRALPEEEAMRHDDDLENVGRVVFLPRYGRAALDLIDDPQLMAPCDELLGADCTMYTMTTVCQPPRRGGRPIHLDLEYRPPGYLIGLGLMVLLDDFTMASGPTRFYPDITEDAPTVDAFDQRAAVLEAPAGSACWFNGGAWHDVLPNETDRWRRAVLIAMIRPWVRQRFDMPRMVAHLDVDTFSPRLRQKLGFRHVAPGSYEEFFLPEDIRKDELVRRAIERG